MKARLILLLLLFPLLTIAQRENIDQNVMQQIRKEGLQNSKVMDIAFQFTDVSGQRLTSSPGFVRAATYAKNQLAKWGLENAMIDPWGEYGKSWELKKSYLAITAPWYKPMQAWPKVWTGGTNGLKNAQVFLVTAKDSAGLVELKRNFKGKLKGKIIIQDRNETYTQSFKPDARRYSDSELDSMANYKPVTRTRTTDTATINGRREQMRAERAFLADLKAFAMADGALAMLTTSLRNHDGTIFVQQAGPNKVTDPPNFLDIAIGWEDYMTMVRLLRNKIPVKLDIDVQTKFLSADTKGYNVLAEIKGTDNNLKDEVIMLGGHLDSWHSSTGATDNASGCAIMMEAVRILKTLGIKPRRTIRIALWSGEEGGLFGSKGYVKKTFADPADMKLLPAHEKLSAYFNLDNGTGKIRGIYLQGNEGAKNIFSQWLTPFHDLGAKTVTISNTPSTDHVSFDAVGLPGFQFIQDPIEYSTRTHHSNMDSYDHLIANDLKQAAVIVAAFVYNAAMRDEKIPRKEMPKPTLQR